MVDASLYFLVFPNFLCACVCFPGLSDGGPPSGCSLQSQSSFDFCNPPTPSQTQAQGQGDSSPFPEAEVINAFSSSTGTHDLM